MNHKFIFSFFAQCMLGNFGQDGALHHTENKVFNNRQRTRRFTDNRGTITCVAPLIIPFYCAHKVFVASSVGMLPRVLWMPTSEWEVGEDF